MYGVQLEEPDGLVLLQSSTLARIEKATEKMKVAGRDRRPYSNEVIAVLAENTCLAPKGRLAHLFRQVSRQDSHLRTLSTLENLISS